MRDFRKFYIGDGWVAPVSTTEFPVLIPATEEQVGVIMLGNEADVDRAVATAKSAFDSYSRTSKEERLALLRNLLAKTKRRFRRQSMPRSSTPPVSLRVSSTL